MGGKDSLSAAQKVQKLQIFVSIIFLIPSILGTVFAPDDTSPWVLGVLQIITAIASAALGANLQRDTTRSLISNHVKSSARHLYDLAIFVNLRIYEIQDYRLKMSPSNPDRIELRRESVTRSFTEVENDLRRTTVSLDSAIRAWSDLNQDAVDEEEKRYKKIYSEQLKKAGWSDDE